VRNINPTSPSVKNGPLSVGVGAGGAAAAAPAAGRRRRRRRRGLRADGRLGDAGHRCGETQRGLRADGRLDGTEQRSWWRPCRWPRDARLQILVRPYRKQAFVHRSWCELRNGRHRSRVCVAARVSSGIVGIVWLVLDRGRRSPARASRRRKPHLLLGVMMLLILLTEVC
jgi:hypothetical protein